MGSRAGQGKLTYDTTLQVISWTAQKDLFLDLSLLGRHLLAFLVLAAGVEAERRGGSKGGAKREVKRSRRKSRTSCCEEGKDNGGTKGIQVGGAHCWRAGWLALRLYVYIDICTVYSIRTQRASVLLFTCSRPLLLLLLLLLVSLVVVALFYTGKILSSSLLTAHVTL